MKTPVRFGLLGAAAGAGVLLASRLARQARRVDFRDRVVVITGGSRGLGLVLARELAAEGAKLALVARQSDELDRAREDLRAVGAEVAVFPCNVGDRAAVELA